MDQRDLAAAAYQQAISSYLKIGNLSMTHEPQAGLAQLALEQGDRVKAQNLVEMILPTLTDHSRARVFTPFYSELICYRVLVANDDTRAASLLQRTEQRLRECAEAIKDAALRRLFLEQVAVHRTVIALSFNTD